MAKTNQGKDKGGPRERQRPTKERQRRAREGAEEDRGEGGGGPRKRRRRAKEGQRRTDEKAKEEATFLGEGSNPPLFPNIVLTPEACGSHALPMPFHMALVRGRH